jgi:hypothetical protein
VVASAVLVEVLAPSHTGVTLARSHDSQRPIPSERSSTHQLRLILSPEPISTLVPAPLLVVRRRSDGARMGVFAATSRLLAEEIARRWHGSVELLPIGDHQHPRGHSGDTKGKPRWVS